MTTQLTVPWPMLTCRAPGAGRLQPGDFGALVGWAQIQVEPVLDGLACGNLEEYQVGSDAIFRAALRRLEADLVFLLSGTAPAHRGFPEAGDPGWVGGVNAQALDAYFHVALIVAHGSTNREAAAAVFLSPKTVEILRSPGPSRLTGLL